MPTLATPLTAPELERVATDVLALTTAPEGGAEAGVVACQVREQQQNHQQEHQDLIH